MRGKALSLALLLFASALAGCIQEDSEEPDDRTSDDIDANDVTDVTEQLDLESCEDAGGTWIEVRDRPIDGHCVQGADEDDRENEQEITQEGCEERGYNWTEAPDREGEYYCDFEVEENREITQEDCERRNGTWIETPDRPIDGYCDFGEDDDRGDEQEITQEGCEERGFNWTEAPGREGVFYCDFGDDANNNTDTRTWSVVDLNSTMLQEGVISRSMCGLIFAWAAWDGAGATIEENLRQKISDNRSGDAIDVWSAIYEDGAMTVQIQEIKSYAEANANGSGTFILVENGNMSSILDPNAETHAGCEGELNVVLNALMDDLVPPPTLFCGDGVIDANEECDDGNFDDGDGCSSSCTQEDDSDGDGVMDTEDAFPNDGNEWEDNDGDGVGDNADAFPNDASETTDSDGDGVGDNGDAFPNDANESADSDGDGVGDNADQCDDTESGATIGEDGCEEAEPQVHFIDISGMAFSPSTLTISVGDTVTWTNQDGAPHSATGDNGEFDSGTLSNGQTFSFTFTTAGTYTYHCAIHNGMTATIIVE